jgi:hypothetical protein
MILQGLKPRIFDRLNESGRNWLKELPAVVWSLRTTPSRATRFTPVFLVYGAEVVLPTDLEYGSPRVRGYDKGANQRAHEDSLDQLDEARTVALMHSTRHQQALRCYQARKIRCLYPCPNTTPSRSRLQHLLPKLMPWRQCTSYTRHQFVSSLYSGHVITYSRMFPFPSTNQPFCRMMVCYGPHVPLPNALRKIPCRMVFLYQTRPTNQSLSCTKFWC